MVDTIPLGATPVGSSEVTSPLCTPTAVPTTTAVFTYADGRMDRRNAALYIGLAVKTLAMHACHGTGPPFVKRGRVFYYREDLDQWLREGRVMSSAQAVRSVAKPAKAPTKMKTVESGKQRNRPGDGASGDDADRSASLTAQPRADPNTGVDSSNAASVDLPSSPPETWRERLKVKREGAA